MAYPEIKRGNAKPIDRRAVRTTIRATIEIDWSHARGSKTVPRAVARAIAAMGARWRGLRAAPPIPRVSARVVHGGVW